MIPFTASKYEIMDGYNGREGTFIRGFILSDKRNKNGWRVTRESIKANYTDFVGRPGIEYIKCGRAACTRDHTKGTSYKKAMSAQEIYRVSNIISVDWDEEKGVLSAVEHIIDPAFAKKVAAGQITYRSPSIWPKEVERLGVENGRVIEDAHDWYALHNAHVDNPAFGEDARLYTSCTGHGSECKHHMGAKVDNITDLIPHNGQMIYAAPLDASCTSCENKKLNYKSKKLTDLLDN